jgi:hypothetical protein
MEDGRAVYQPTYATVTVTISCELSPFTLLHVPSALLVYSTLLPQFTLIEGDSPARDILFGSVGKQINRFG